MRSCFHLQHGFAFVRVLEDADLAVVLDRILELLLSEAPLQNLFKPRSVSYFDQYFY